jgi:hypothetical protein
MASSIDGNSLAQAFISARELDASLGEQPSAFVTLAEAAAQAAPLATNFIEKTLTRVDGQPISNIPNEPVTLLRVVRNKAAGATDAEPAESELFQFSALSELAAIPVREEVN